ncbi:phosphotransferase [Glycomyces rhizosphaerae]|uniref:Phosphotransferase n=1 Tax=Glycomyces rhizosphaerae TaxID=2054422 RepID=A0ABV7Q4V1_9ACTN
MGSSERSVLGRILRREHLAGEDIRQMRLGRSGNTAVVETDRHVVRVAWCAPIRVDVETRVWRAARQAGIPVPELLGHGSIDAHEYMVYRRLPGWPSPTSGPALREAGAMLAAVHAAPLDGFPAALRSRPRRMRRFALAKAFLAAQAHRVAPRTAACVQRAERDWTGTFDTPTHGDFRGANLLARGDRISGVLDWSDARRSSREADLGSVERARLPDVLDGYLSAASAPRGDLLLGYVAARYAALAHSDIVRPDEALAAIDHCAQTLSARKIVIDTGGTDQSC